MRFIIADTFLKSLAQLDGESQGQVKQAAFEFQTNPANPGFKFHKLDRAKDDRFWSFRVNRDVRIIVHRDGSNSLMLCYAGHHDDAYRWAERRRLETHPQTGAAQVVEVRERVEEIVRQVVREEEAPIFAKYEKDYLLGLGVPTEWVDALRTVGESAFLDIADELPEEAGQRLLQLAAGQAVPLPISPHVDSPLLHPDAQRRFREVSTQTELSAALDAPWQEWIVFLHPDQRALVERSAGGPKRVTGGAGTGKSVVAMHRAAHLARSLTDGQVLLTTFSKALAFRLSHHVGTLMGTSDPARARVDVRHLHALAAEIAQSHGDAPFIEANRDSVRHAIDAALLKRSNEWMTAAFIESEWRDIIDAHALRSWEEYQAVSRRGRGTPLSAKKRKLVWGVMEAVLSELQREGTSTFNQLCRRAAEHLQRAKPPYQHAVVDECQDFGPAELTLIRALCPTSDNDLFFCGDEAQRIYKPKTSWLSLGIDIRGRSESLKLNYRTTEQIRRRADAVLPPRVEDGDGMTQERAAVSVLSGPSPDIQGLPTPQAESNAVAEWIRSRLDEGFKPNEIGVFARTHRLLSERVEPALKLAKLKSVRLADETVPEDGKVAVGTMHAAKGLEFRAVVLMGCDHASLPLRSVASKIADAVEREDFIEQERHLLYVACTRARERLMVTWTGRGAKWLLD